MDGPISPDNLYCRKSIIFSIRSHGPDPLVHVPRTPAKHFRLAVFLPISRRLWLPSAFVVLIFRHRSHPHRPLRSPFHCGSHLISHSHYSSSWFSRNSINQSHLMLSACIFIKIFIFGPWYREGRDNVHAQVHFNSQSESIPARERCDQLPHDWHLVKPS